MLCKRAESEDDSAELLKVLIPCFSQFLRVGEARALRFEEAFVSKKYGADQGPAGLLIRDSGSGRLPGEVRPKGARMPGQLEWAPCVDQLAVDSLRRLAGLDRSVKAAAAERVNTFIQKVAEEADWGTGWWTVLGLRHGRVGDCLRAGIPDGEIQRAGRWRSRGAFEVYLN